MTFKEYRNNELFIELSHGNKKLLSNDRVQFLIWNLPAVITCPHATDHCIEFCYARKAEKIYPSAVKSRQEHFEISRCDDFVDRMIYTINGEITRPSNKNKKIVFRIHESGDFYNKAYTDKWLTIMRHFESNKKIVFVAYTKSVKYFDGVDLPKNFSLLASVWDDTAQNNLEIIARNNYRIYTAYKGDELTKAINNGFSLCRCEDCATCGKCWNKRVNNITCQIH